MVLYCVVHPANIIKAIVHKLKYHEDEEAVFLTEKNDDSPYCIKIDKITYIKMPDPLQILTDVQSKEEVIAKTTTVIDEFVKQNNIDLQYFSHRYTIFDTHSPFNLYFELNGLDYICIESYDNWFKVYSDKSFIDRHMKQLYYFNCLVWDMNLQNAQGTHCIKGYLFSDKSKYPDGFKTPVDNFNYIRSLIELNNSQKKKLIDALHLNEYKFDTVLLFNSTLWTNDVMNKHQVLAPDKYHKAHKYGHVSYLYKIIIDYYFKRFNFCLKLHPTSDTDFVKDFAEFQQLPNYLPFDIFAITGKKFYPVSLAQTTSVELFKDIGYETECFGWQIIPFFNNIHFVNLALITIQTFEIPQKIYCYGIEAQQVAYLKKWAFPDLKDTEIDKLDYKNIEEAEYIIANYDNKLNGLLKSLNRNSVVFVNKDCRTYELNGRKIVCSLVDISENDNQELQHFEWCVLGQLYKLNKVPSDLSYNLKYSKLRADMKFIQPVNLIELEEMIASNIKDCQELKKRESNLLQYSQYLQMYYEAEQAGYNLYDFLSDNGYISDNVKIALYAVDEFGIAVYRICKRCGIDFSVLLSDRDREIKFITHQNMIETLSFKAFDKVNKADYTLVLKAVVWNPEQISFFRKHNFSGLLFDAIARAIYTRAFFINKIAELSQKYPGVRIGVFSTPYIGQIPGEHSEIENYFMKHGSMKVSTVLDIEDETIKNRAKELCYKQYGFDDEYIENVCNASYPMISYNGIYMLPDFSSKYVNVINHRRVTTDQPSEFSNTVYFFGDSMITGLNVGDAETIESNFQRIINASGLPYIVHNCANSSGLRYDWIFGLTDTMTFKPGDILLFCSRVDWLTEQYIKQNNKKLLSNILGIYTTPVFQRPHDHGEVFTDDHHCNGKGYGLIAQKIFDDIKAAGFFDKGNIADEEEMKTANMPSNNVDDITRGGG